MATVLDTPSQDHLGRSKCFCSKFTCPPVQPVDIVMAPPTGKESSSSCSINSNAPCSWMTLAFTKGPFASAGTCCPTHSTYCACTYRCTARDTHARSGGVEVYKTIYLAVDNFTANISLCCVRIHHHSLTLALSHSLKHPHATHCPIL